MTPADGLRRALRHLWHPATTEAALNVAAALHRPVGARVIAERIVVVRTDNGLAAFPDRCLHRSIALSAGSVDDNCLVCAGHGWRWAADGRCVAIPDLPSRGIPARARLEVLDVALAHGLVWVRLETTADTCPPRLGDAHFDGPAIDVPAGAARIVDLLLDPERWLRMLGLTAERIGAVRVHESGPGVITAQTTAGAWSIEVELHVPFATRFEARRSGVAEAERSVVTAVAPTDDHASRVYWHVNDDAVLAPAFASMLHTDGDLLMDADSSPSMLAPGHELSVASDGMSVAYRRAMADLVAAARQGPGPLAALVRTA